MFELCPLSKMQYRHKKYLRIRHYVDLSLWNTNLAVNMCSVPVVFPDNNLLWYEVKVLFTVDNPSVKNNLWQLLHYNFEIFSISYILITVFLQQTCGMYYRVNSITATRILCYSWDQKPTAYGIIKKLSDGHDIWKLL